ncbi:hypothetical protein [Streptomyces sp. NPDC056672]|uniref:hypothetical protein n=1 Tax=Streptomyces sp. NPDC056672 TaxID=3345906 RepID=UPI0036BAE33A
MPAALLALGAAMVFGTGTSPAAADPVGDCTATRGAVVAVDFGPFGGTVERGCDTTPTTGYELLHEAGFTTEGTGHGGPAFICRIGSGSFNSGTRYPTPDKDDCVLTPRATAHWSYWIASPGQDEWSSSPLGAMDREPEAGDVDVWVFGGTDIEGTEGRPTLTPDQLRVRNTEPVGSGSQDKPAPRPSGTEGGEAEKPPAPAPAPSAKVPAPAPPAVVPSPSTTAPVPAAPSPSSTTAPPASPPPSSASAAPSGDGRGNGDGDGDERRVVDAAPAAEAAHDSGSTLPATVTAGLLLVIAGAAVFAASRRRRAE